MRTEAELSIERQQDRAAWRPRFQPFNEHLYAQQEANQNSHCFLWDDHICHQAQMEMERAEAEAEAAYWSARYAETVAQ